MCLVLDRAVLFGNCYVHAGVGDSTSIGSALNWTINLSLCSGLAIPQ